MRLLAISAALSIALAQSASAQFDDFKKLEGKVVVKAGSIEPIYCDYDKYDCDRWPDNLS
jgi:hypothetical protein